MSSGLSHLRVIELGGGVSAALAAKLLADLGATVIKVEPPGGDPERARGPFRPGAGAADHPGGGFLFLNGGKRSRRLDLHRQPAREELWELAQGADLVIHNLPPAEMEPQGVTFEKLSRANPRLVLLSLTPFGLTGPYRNFLGGELVTMHGGGWGWLCPGKSSPLELPPIKLAGRHAEAQVGLHGAVAALAACHGAAASGVGEHIDLSGQEVIAYLLARHFAAYTYTGETDKRTTPTLYEPMSIYPCADGFAYLICAEPAQWQRLAALMGNPGWAQGLDLRKLSQEDTRRLKQQVSDWTATHSKQELFTLCQQERVGAAPVLNFAEIEAQPQFEARAFFAAQSHPTAGPLTLPGAPYHLNMPWWQGRAPAPELDEAAGAGAGIFPPRQNAPRPPTSPATDAATEPAAVSAAGAAPGATPPPGAGPPQPALAAPLGGVRVLDLSWVWAGPHCTALMAMLGAEVIKVETTARADLTRRSGMAPRGMEAGLNRCGYFNQINQGKKSIAVNLAHPEGLGLIEELAAKSDVMVSNFGTGVLEKLGLAPEKMQSINPRLIVASISGFGQTGPARHYTAYGPLITALGGVVGETGYPGGEPGDVGMAYGDPNGGVYTAVAIMAALNARSETGEAPVIDVSMCEAMLATSFDGWMNHALGNAPFPQMANRDPYCAPHNLYRCSGEDRWVAIAVTTETQWQGLCAALKKPEWLAEPGFRDAPARKANEDALDHALAQWCAGRERWEVTHHLQARGVPAFPCLDTRDLVEDPHMQARGGLTNFPHPEVGVRTLMGAPWRLANRAPANQTAAPLLGQHTDAVLETLLGRDAAQRAELREKGAIE